MALRKGFIRGFVGLLGFMLLPMAESAQLYRYQNDQGVTVVDWYIPAAYASRGYEVLNESGQVMKVVPRAPTDSELAEQAAEARERQLAEEAERAQRERDTFLLRRYSSTDDIAAARDRAIRELDIRIAILSSQRGTLSDQLAVHQENQSQKQASGIPLTAYENDTISALQAEIASVDEAIQGRKDQSEAIREAYQRDIERFVDLEDIVELRRSLGPDPRGASTASQP